MSRFLGGIALANVNVTIRMDENLKKEADALFDELGMSFTTAINIFVRQSLREGRIPFDVRARKERYRRSNEQDGVR